MLWAKLAVCASAVFLTMVVSSLIAFFLGQAAATPDAADKLTAHLRLGLPGRTT